MKKPKTKQKVPVDSVLRRLNQRANPYAFVFLKKEQSWYFFTINTIVQSYPKKITKKTQFKYHCKNGVTRVLTKFANSSEESAANYRVEIVTDYFDRILKIKT